MPTAIDLTDLQSSREERDRLWVTDLAECATREGELWCAVGLDVCSCPVVAWSIDTCPTAPLVTNALGMSIDPRRHWAGDTLITPAKAPTSAAGHAPVALSTLGWSPR